MLASSQTWKSPPTHACLETLRPPSLTRATDPSAKVVASLVFVMSTLPVIFVLLLMFTVLVNSEDPYTLRPSPIARFLAIPTPPVTLKAPSAA